MSLNGHTKCLSQIFHLHPLQVLQVCVCPTTLCVDIKELLPCESESFPVANRMGSSPKKNSAKSKATATTDNNVVDNAAAETAALDAAIAAVASNSNNNGATVATTVSTKKISTTKPKTASTVAASTTTSAASWWYEAGWGAVMLYGLYVAATTAYSIRLGAINEYGPVIHEFDPYFNYRATEVSCVISIQLAWPSVWRTLYFPSPRKILTSFSALLMFVESFPIQLVSLLEWSATLFYLV
jgi:hypothetical protein